MMIYALIILGGLIFIVYNLVFSSGGKSKFRSDLPKTKEVVKKKKVDGGMFLSFVRDFLGVLVLALFRGCHSCCCSSGHCLCAYY